jgi:hypothetical protein
VELAGLAGDPLRDDLGVLVDENAHENPSLNHRPGLRTNGGA